MATEKLNDREPVNLESGTEISIKELTELIAELTGFEGDIVWNTAKPDGQPRRALDTSRARELLGFQSATDFRDGLQRTIDWYVRHSMAGSTAN